uniref:Uncharacterized protein n=1 Tax=Phaeomonas parva TaxID=124430 RepID=A0A7S1UHR0_9STRA|mmetsp:Transcript_4737/g.13490  ORF Transcript_4737/g.13490 Transcript_4737/m.13490 type:complete len:1082 (+) Transcript_4737:247-3492(+)
MDGSAASRGASADSGGDGYSPQHYSPTRSLSPSRYQALSPERLRTRLTPLEQYRTQVEHTPRQPDTILGSPVSFPAFPAFPKHFHVTNELLGGSNVYPSGFMAKLRKDPNERKPPRLRRKKTLSSDEAKPAAAPAPKPKPTAGARRPRASWHACYAGAGTDVASDSGPEKSDLPSRFSTAGWSVSVSNDSGGVSGASGSGAGSSPPLHGQFPPKKDTRQRKPASADKSTRDQHEYIDEAIVKEEEERARARSPHARSLAPSFRSRSPTSRSPEPSRAGFPVDGLGEMAPNADAAPVAASAPSPQDAPVRMPDAAPAPPGDLADGAPNDGGSMSPDTLGELRPRQMEGSDAIAGEHLRNRMLSTDDVAVATAFPLLHEGGDAPSFTKHVSASPEHIYAKPNVAAALPMLVGSAGELAAAPGAAAHDRMVSDAADALVQHLKQPKANFRASSGDGTIQALYDVVARSLAGRVRGPVDRVTVLAAQKELNALAYNAGSGAPRSKAGRQWQALGSEVFSAHLKDELAGRIGFLSHGEAPHASKYLRLLYLEQEALLQPRRVDTSDDLSLLGNGAAEIRMLPKAPFDDVVAWIQQQASLGPPAFELNPPPSRPSPRRVAGEVRVPRTPLQPRTPPKPKDGEEREGSVGELSAPPDLHDDPEAEYRHANLALSAKALDKVGFFGDGTPGSSRVNSRQASLQSVSRTPSRGGSKTTPRSMSQSQEGVARSISDSPTFTEQDSMSTLSYQFNRVFSPPTQHSLQRPATVGTPWAEKDGLKLVPQEEGAPALGALGVPEPKVQYGFHMAYFDTATAQWKPLDAAADWQDAVLGALNTLKPNPKVYVTSWPQGAAASGVGALREPASRLASRAHAGVGQSLSLESPKYSSSEPLYWPGAGPEAPEAPATNRVGPEPVVLKAQEVRRLPGFGGVAKKRIEEDALTAHVLQASASLGSLGVSHRPVGAPHRAVTLEKTGFAPSVTSSLGSFRRRVSSLSTTRFAASASASDLSSTSMPAAAAPRFKGSASLTTLLDAGPRGATHVDNLALSLTSRSRAVAQRDRVRKRRSHVVNTYSNSLRKYNFDRLLGDYA